MAAKDDRRYVLGLSKDEMLDIMEEHFQNSEINAVIDQAVARIAAKRQQMIRNCVEEARTNNTNVITIKKLKLIEPIQEEQ